jgi:5S rRNA maturation endonuclease (ribonuclease M5)
MEYTERIKEFELLIAHLVEANREIPVVVEGDQDVRCLRALGLKGTMIKVHTGKTFYEFCQDLSAKYPQVILLMDWDRRGEQIHQQLTRDLDAEWSPYNYFREGLKFLCYPDIQEVEQLARLLENLKLLEEKSSHPEQALPTEQGNDLEER